MKVTGKYVLIMIRTFPTEPRTNFWEIQQNHLTIRAKLANQDD